MDFVIVLAPFIVAGIVVIFVAFSGGPSQAREAYLTRGGRFFSISMILLYIGLGIAVPAAVIAARPAAVGGTGHLRGEDVESNKKLDDGKQLFTQTCKSCHTLAAVDAHGITGPNLDELSGLDKQRVLNAIKIGGTGDGRMPPQLLTGSSADDVATYVSTVAGR